MAQRQNFTPASESTHILNFELIVESVGNGNSNYQIDAKIAGGCTVIPPVVYNDDSQVWTIITYGQPDLQQESTNQLINLGNFNSNTATFIVDSCQFAQQPQNLEEHADFYKAQSMQSAPAPMTAQKRRKTIVYNQPIIHKSLIHKIIKWLSRVFGSNS